MRTFYGYQVFTDRNVNTGQLDLRYIRLSGNDNTAVFNNGMTVSGNFISNGSGIFLNGINVSGDFYLNGEKLIIPTVAPTYIPDNNSEAGIPE